MDYEIKGLDRLVKQLENLGKTEEVEKAINKASIFVKDQAKVLCPVDTGDLRKSIDHEVVNNNGEITGYVFCDNTVDYASYVEFGTSKMAAQPFMTPALEENKDIVRDIIKQALMDSINGA